MLGGRRLLRRLENFVLGRPFESLLIARAYIASLQAVIAFWALLSAFEPGVWSVDAALRNILIDEQ
jgi:hypothetical protein